MILVQEHGQAALRVAEDRRSLHAAGSDSFLLWTQIAEAAGRLIGAEPHAPVTGAHH